jgi:DNA-binding NtrC family response regulator
MGMLAASVATRAISAVPVGTGLRRDKVLIVEGEKESRGVLCSYIEDKGYEVATAGTCALAEQAWRATRPDVAILDYNLPDGDALDLIPRLKAIDASIPIIILTGYGSIDLAVEAVRLGAESFLPKPAELSTLLVMVERSLENQRHQRQKLAEKTMSHRGTLDPFLGKSDSIRRLAELAHRVAFSDTPVLIQGETGTGKSTMARWLHQNGPRASEPFVEMNCSGLSQDLQERELFGDDQDDIAGTLHGEVGLLEIGHKGTVLLERIENVDFQSQSKLLKVVEEKQFRRLGEVCDRQVDVRLMATTQQVMAQPALRKHFRGDLYCHIRWMTLSVPPLRERVEDIPMLSAHILGKWTAELGTGSLELGQVALRALQGYSWPGNVRELRNVLERVALVARNDMADEDLHFDAHVDQYLAGIGQFRTLEEMERNYIQQVLHKERGRVQSAARKLGIPRSSLYHKLKQYKTNQSGIHPLS